MGGSCKFLVYPHMNPTITPAELHALFIKSQAETLAPHEAQRLEQWRAASPEHEREWAQLLALWQVAPPSPMPQGASLETQWANLSARMGQAAAENSSRAESWSKRARRWFAPLVPQPRWAFAGIALVLLLALLRLSDFTRAPEMQTVHAPFGERIQLTLADGSHVELNAGSSLHYPKKFSAETRAVELNGEAFFEVRPEATPFEITTPHAAVRVLGTSFNVRTWERATTVFVQSGKVALRSQEAANAILLEAGQAARCDTLRVPLRLEFSVDQFAWREGKLVFHRQPLAAVLDELQRHFDVRIQAEASLLAHTVTASFANESVSTVLDAIAVAIHARCERNTEGYWLRPQQAGGRE